MANKGKYYESQFEEATIELLHESHWQYTFGDDIHRKYTDPLIEEDLRSFLIKQYEEKNLTATEIDGIVANLRNTGGQNDYHALRHTFLLYRDGYDFAYSDCRDNPFRLVGFFNSMMQTGMPFMKSNMSGRRFSRPCSITKRYYTRCTYADLHALYARYSGIAEILRIGSNK